MAQADTDGAIPSEAMLSAGVDAFEDAIYYDHGIMGINVVPEMAWKVYTAMERVRLAESCP